MALHVQGGPGCFIVMAVLLIPAIVAAVLFHSAWWLIGVPIALLVIWVALGKWGPGRNVTPAQFADELEKHLLGTEGPWDWDDITSLRIADDRLDRLRSSLLKFDTLGLEERRKEFMNIIMALRRGEIPELKRD
jgi:hypothetical protein